MTSRSDATAGDTPGADFEAALETLIVESFAKGVAVQGTWEVTPASSVVPNWKITIEKTDDADLPQDEPRFLDE